MSKSESHIINKGNILSKIRKDKGAIAILIDPEKTNSKEQVLDIIRRSEIAKINYFFIGGSTVTKEQFEKTVKLLKENTNIPLIIFPGGSHQVSEQADALLYLSLISGRNPDYLIGQHVRSAKEIFEMDLEVIPTGYLLIDGGKQSSVAYVSQTTPIPRDNNTIILDTIKAGILQGKQIIFCDAGSGAKYEIPSEIVSEIKQLNIPLIIGGGINTIEKVQKLKESGANVIVIGNKIEEDINFLLDLSNMNKHQL